MLDMHTQTDEGLKKLAVTLTQLPAWIYICRLGFATA